jgi:hypothetical protein
MRAARPDAPAALEEVIATCLAKDRASSGDVRGAGRLA